MVPTHAATTPTGLSIAPVSVITPQLQAPSTFVQRRAQDVKVSGGKRKCTRENTSHMNFFSLFVGGGKWNSSKNGAMLNFPPFFLFSFFFFSSVNVTQPHDVLSLQVLCLFFFPLN